MFKHPHCGGQHSTVAEARSCERQPAGTRSLVDVPVGAPATPSPNRSAVLASLRRHAEHTVAASQGTRSINAPRRGYVNMATDPQVSYLEGLIKKRDWQGRNSQEGMRIIEMVGLGARPTFEEARYLIEELRDMPRKEQGAETMDRHGFADPHPTSSQGTPTRGQWAEAKRLKEQVPDGRYAVDLPGETKVKFFRIRTNKANGWFRITHMVSDDRFPWPTKRYMEVLRAIIQATPQAAGLRFAEEYGQCFNCGRALTDTDNPYKVYGLGPDCGPKRMG